MGLVQQKIDYQFKSITRKALYIELVFYFGLVLAPVVTVMIIDKESTESKMLRTMASIGTLLFAFIELANERK